MRAAVVVSSESSVPSDWRPLQAMVDDCCDSHLVLCPAGVEIPAGMPSRRLERTDPVSALKAALVWAHDESVLLVAADIAAPSAELARYLEYVRAGHDAVLPMFDAHTPQPLFAIYTPACMNHINAALLSGKYDISDLLGMLTVRLVDAAEVSKFGEPATLLSLGG